MKFKERLIILLVLTALLNSCRKDQLNDCFQSTGKDVTETRSLDPFTKIKIGEVFDMILTQDTSLPEQIKITAGKHIIGQIITKIKGGILTIENKNTCNFVRSYNRKITIELRVKFLDDIEIFSATNLSSPDTLHFDYPRHLKLKNFGLGDVNLKIKTGTLDVRTINSGNVILEGFANIFTCSIEEVTMLDARKLLCDDLYIDCHTPLDCFVNARNYLFARIYNSGHIFYVSTPIHELKLVEQRGSGQLLKL